MKLNLSVIFELIALIISIINYRNLQKTILRWFIPFLIVTNIIEWGNFFKLFSINHSNNWIFNFFIPVEFCFYGWVFFNIIIVIKAKLIIKYLGTGLIMVTILNMFFVQGLRNLNSYTYMIGSVYVILCVYYYFKQLIDNVNDFNILQNAFFWISVGLLLFYSCEFFLMAFFEYFLSIGDFKSFQPIFHFVNIFLNITMYSCFSISFFCKPQQQDMF